MPLLKRLSDALWSYVSPSKPAAEPSHLTSQVNAKRNANRDIRDNTRRDTKHNTRRPTPTQDAFTSLRHHHRSMSPLTRVKTWHISPSPPPQRKRKRPSISTTTKNPPRKVRKTVELASNTDMDLEGDTLMDFDDTIIVGTASLSLSHAATPSPSPTPSRSPSPPSWSPEASIDDTLVVPEDEYVTNYSKKRISLAAQEISQHITVPDLVGAGWAPDAIPLVRKIFTRGYEPLLPSSWVWDFRFLPDALFLAAAEEGKGRAAIDCKAGPHREYHATRALRKLIEMGPRTTDRVVAGLPPETVLGRETRAYVKWAARDGDVEDVIPLVTVVRGGRDVEQMLERARGRMVALRERWRDALTGEEEETPTVYGLVCHHTAVGVMASDAAGGTRDLVFLEFKDKDYHVWNSLALAILVTHTRNVLMDFKEKEMGLRELPVKPGALDDPDA